MFFTYIDGADLVLHSNAVIGLTGGPAADFNMALFDEDPDELAVFDDFVSRVNAKRISAMAVLSGAATRRLGAAAKSKGLVEAGTAPLMARSGALPDTPLRNLSPNELLTRGKCQPSATSRLPPLSWIENGLLAHSGLHRCLTHPHWVSTSRIEEVCR
jgi:hypothetical protein